MAAVMSQHTDAVAEMDSRLELMALGDLRAELLLTARWGLAELRREHELTRIVMKEGERFPEIAAAFHDAIVRQGHRMAAEWIARRGREAGRPIADPEAASAVFVGSLVGYTLQEVLFGPGFAGVDDERFLAAWVDGTLAMLESLTAERSPAHA